MILGISRSSRSSSSKPVDVIEFTESEWGLGRIDPNNNRGFRLFPIQKVILKIHYGLELDDNPHGLALDEPVPLGFPDYDKITDLVGDDNPDMRTENYGYYKYRIKVTNWRRQELRYMTEAGYLRYLYEEGRCNIKEVDGERRELILSIGRRSGKCVLNDTLILTDGGIKQIGSLGDLNGPEIQPLVIGVAQEGAKKSQSSHFYNGGIKPTRTFTTYCGYELGGTHNHRIKIMDESGHIVWKYLGDLKVGDYAALHRGTDLWAKDYLDVIKYHNDIGSNNEEIKDAKRIMLPNVLDETWALLLGYLVGDGTWGHRHTVEVTIAHHETWDRLKSIFIDLFGRYRIKMDKRSTSNLGCLIMHSVSVRQFLHDLGFTISLSKKQQEVPWSIFVSPRPVVQAFLRGLFESDGCIDTGGTVSYSCTNPKLAQQVQTLLLNFGIPSRIRCKMVKSRGTKEPYYELSVLGNRGVRMFSEHVGFDSGKKCGRLAIAVSKLASVSASDTEAIPYQKQYIRELLESTPKSGMNKGWNRQKLRATMGGVIKPGSDYDLSYFRLDNILDVAKTVDADPAIIDHFNNIQNTNYFYDRVVNIVDGENYVCDLTVPDGESFVGNGFTNHNTLLASVISAYETYKLLMKHDPHSYYGVAASNPIHIVSVATDREQASLSYKEVSGHFQGCDFFSTYMAHSTQSFASFQTPRDIEKYGRYADNPMAKASIIVTFKSCVAKSVRGMGIIVVILDEMAHFTDDGQSSADEVYNAIRPATSAYSEKSAADSQKDIGPVESRIVAISSPAGRQGKFYELFQKGMKGGAAARNMLCIQAPTWEVNPTIPASEFEDAYMKDPNVFATEYGGEFSDRTRGWIEHKKDLFACIDPARRPLAGAPARMPHFVGLDIGLVNDWTAIAVGHIEAGGERGPVIVLDLVDRIKAGVGKYSHRERLELDDDVVEWVHKFSRQFYIVHGIFDQWAGIPFQQSIIKKGLNQIQLENFTEVKNSEVFKNFKDMMWDRRIVLYDHPILEGKDHCEYIEEMCELQADQKSKNITKVHKPNIEGKSDDMSDAIVRMVWLASQHLSKSKYISGLHPGGSYGGSRSFAGDYTRFVANRRMGSSPDRQQHRTQRGRILGR